MGVLLLLLTSPPSTLRVVGGGSAAGPSHSRTSRNVRLESANWAKADIDQVAVTTGLPRAVAMRAAHAGTAAQSGIQCLTRDQLPRGRPRIRDADRAVLRVFRSTSSALRDNGRGRSSN